MERLVHAKVTGPHSLWLVFSDGKAGEVDLKSKLKFTGVFEPLKDPDYFAQGRFDPEGGTVVWPNDADIAPEALYDWVVGHCVHEWAKHDTADAPNE